MTVEVRHATLADAAAIGEVFALAFAQDPVTSWVTPDAGRRARLLVRLNTAIARYEGIRLGATYVAVDAGRLVGAAIWRPPGRAPLRFGSVRFALVSGVALGLSIPRTIAAGRAAAGARPREPHWYLQLLGVDPDIQGCGVGSALVGEHLRVVDAAGLSACLETTGENVGFYGRLGFEVVGEIAMPVGAPREYSLVRGATGKR
ncbi:MAG TPA: GNAT family N-acetyltransferase [Galbitalea sp.]|jgi:ribosomal protein S18 acetylase RimI-like enzyme|nr:GNAT family N-acetyltransferase [Galbitalea sp.]